MKLKEYLYESMEGSLNERISTNLKQTMREFNVYYKVNAQFSLHILAGHEKSNTYYGSSNVSRPLWKKVNAKKGDEIHSLAGGLFYIDTKKNKAHDMHIEKPEFEPFASGNTVHDKFPLNKIDKIDKTEAWNGRYR